MKVDIKKLKWVLNEKFTSVGYSKEISYSMINAIVNAEMYWKYTHGIIRTKWILNNKLPNSSDFTFKQDLFLNEYDCKNSNWYHCWYQIISNIINKLLVERGFNISIVKNIFPTTCFIDYLNEFQENNLWAILMWTTPKLVWIRNWWKKILWTNPIGFTFPNEKTPIIADLWTSNVPLWKIIYNSIVWNTENIEIINNQWDLYLWNEYYKDNNFNWTLLPFWWKNYEHKGFIFSLLIELITTMFSWKRSEKWDLLIISFHEASSLYNKSAITELFHELLEIEKNVIIPWNKSLNCFKASVEQGYLNIELDILSEIGLNENQIKNIQY